MSEFNPSLLYKDIKEFHSKENFAEPTPQLDTSCLLPTLKPYQVDAVKWMLFKEKYSDLDCQLPSGKAYYLTKGGILADEMGLGKTVEVLCCIMNNPSPVKIPECVPRIKPILEPVIQKRKSTKSETSRPAKKRLKTHESSSSDDEEEKECEETVDIVIEEVIEKYSRPKSGTFAKEKYSLLHKWYESSLSAFSTKRVSHVEPVRQLQCFCDQSSEEDTVKCQECGYYQHRSCVGLEEYDLDQYFCPKCWTTRDPMDSRATFIVSPPSICSQWEAEIKKHVNCPDLKVLIYKGVKGNNYIQPRDLANYDIVITTYNVLCVELNYAACGEQSDRKLRHAKRFFSVTSPLTCVNWWRLCLDEAQMVESYQSKTALMAKELTAVHRWCVTGTPMEKSIHDLFGLVDFLQIYPFNKIHQWKQLVKSDDLIQFLGVILWRTCKSDVLTQLGVPPQKVVQHWLRFSPVEAYFYQRTHNDCISSFKLKLSKFPNIDATLKSLDRLSVNRLMLPLLRLRQACTHPQAVRGKFLKFKHTMTMAELLTAMVTKAQVDVDNCLRLYVSSLNGLAALCILKMNYSEAVEYYRKVLHISTEYKAPVKVDTLQMIHTLFNLGEILEEHGEGIPKTIRDDRLKEDAEALEQNYIKRYEIAVQSSKDYVSKLQSIIAEYSQGAPLGLSNWWVELLDWVVDVDELLRRITTCLDDNRIPGQASLSDKLANLPAVQRELAVWLANADNARMDALKSLRELEVIPVSVLAEKALICHLKKKRTKNVRCPICKCESVLLKYEAVIFSINKKDITEESDEDDNDEDLKSIDPKNKALSDLKNVTVLKARREGSWKQTPGELILQGYAKVKKAANHLIEDGARHMALLKVVRKEFKGLRAFWSYISDQAAAQDEIRMCKTRLRLALPEEYDQVQRNRAENLNVILPFDIDINLRNLEHEAVVSESDLKKNSGVLVYLQNLQKEGEGGQKPCPVCQEDLNGQWAVLSCGHCLCFTCTPVMLNMANSSSIMCPVCRIRTEKDDIKYVHGGEYSYSSSKVSVKGSHSTKVEAVVSELLTIREEDPSVKALIFSTWEKVLDVIEEAFKVNHISFRRFGAEVKYKAGLQQFKNNPVTALLMPLRFGSKGLNLTEATHVFLVEPILNPSEELQAVGRVHRIGQTRETIVHRFVIHETIEEKMLTSLETSNVEEWSADKITLRKLEELFALAPSRSHEKSIEEPESTNSSGPPALPAPCLS